MEPAGGIRRYGGMSKGAFERQAERAESIAGQTADESLKAILQQAARDYREKGGARGQLNPD
jgi:hypothetical protein